MYPAFLDWAGPKKTKMVAKEAGSRFWERKFVWTSVSVVLVHVALSFGLTRLNTDPSLFDYFKKGKQPREGLSYVDRNGGSNPLTVVIAAANGGRLDTKTEYQKMWDLQGALEDHKGVGTVLSAGADGGGESSFVRLPSQLEPSTEDNERTKHQPVASTFVTKDRRLAAFYLRMNERDRNKPRIEVVDNLRTIVRQHGFRPALIGGVYDLQGALKAG